MTREKIKQLRDAALSKFQLYIKAENKLSMQGNGFIDKKDLDDLAKNKKESDRANSEWQTAWLIYLAENGIKREK